MSLQDDCSEQLALALASHVAPDSCSDALAAALGDELFSSDECNDDGEHALDAQPPITPAPHISEIVAQDDTPYTTKELHEEAQHISTRLQLAPVNSKAALADAIMKFDAMLAHATDEQLKHFSETSKETCDFIDEELGLGTTVHLQSDRSNANKRNRSRHKIEPIRTCAASAQIVLEQHMGELFLHHMCRKVHSNNGEPLVYYERHRGDETPYSKMTIEEPAASNTLCHASLEELEDSKDWVTDVYEPKDAGVAAKVWQRRLEIAALFRMATGKYFLVTFELTCPLASISNCDGECYYNLFRKTSDMLDARRLFKRQQRISDSDGDGAIERAERVMSIDDIESGVKPVATLRGKCRQHRIYHNTSKPFKLKSRFQQKLIHSALSLRGPNLLKKFKKLYSRNITDNVEYIFQDPPIGPGPAADAHRNRVYDTYLRSLENGTRRKWGKRPAFYIRTLANGDIRIRGKWQHYCKPGCCRNKKHFIAKLKQHGQQSVFRGLPAVCPRQRWTGADNAIDDQALPEHIHGFYSITTRDWYKAVTGKTAPQHNWDQDAVPELPSDGEASSDGDAPVADGGAPAAEAGICADADGSVGAAVAAARQAVAEDAQEVFKRQQSMYKREFVNFVTSSRMLIELDQVKICFSPVFRMMASSIAMGVAR